MLFHNTFSGVNTIIQIEVRRTTYSSEFMPLQDQQIYDAVAGRNRKRSSSIVAVCFLSVLDFEIKKNSCKRLLNSV
jgi:hypothetical protein